MRLAYVTECWPPHADGAAAHAERCVRYLRARGHSLDLVRLPTPDEPSAADGTGWRAGLRWLPAAAEWRYGRAAAALRRRFREQRRQLVHLATLGPLGRAALVAANSLGLPVSIDFRGDHDLQTLLQRRLHALRLRALHNRAARTFVPTQALSERLAHQGYEQLAVLGHGVDPLLFWPGRRSRALRAAWGAAEAQQRVLLYVGRLTAQGQAEQALRAFEALRYLRPDTRMVVVGDGPLRPRLQALHPGACFAGAQHGETLAQHYASADVLLLPCRGTGAGQAALEALASGLVVVALDGMPLPPQTIGHGVLLAPDDGGGFIATVARAAALAEPQSPLRLCARQIALGASWDAVLRRFDAQLGGLLADKAALARGRRFVPA